MNEACMNETTVVITRLFDAPRARVFEAWTRAEHLARWFAPRGFSITDCAAEARPGGVFRLCMRSPRGEAYWVRGEYREVLPPERLVIACSMDASHGATQLDELIQVQFETSGSRTRLHLESTARGIGAVAASLLAGMQKGWAQTVDRLRDLLRPRPHEEM
jgi:uncharacterized protein YndB with AHSA1/START domain